jgi:prolipoprotein diacylglyceryl transferase
MAKSLAFIPSPSSNSFSIGPLVIHYYALMYLVGIAVAIIMTRRRWSAVGGDPDLVGDVALWSVPAGIIGGRIYFDITTPMDIPHVWYGVFAVWQGGLGIWGGIALAAVVGLWRIRRAGANGAMFMDAVAPALLVAQGIGRIGNYFNKELFGGPTTLPWGLEIPYQYRVSGGIPVQDLRYSTFQPTFLYEMIFDFALAAALIWLGHHRKIKPPGLFALYVFGYSAYRIFEEALRVDSSVHIFGLRLNMYIACALTIVGAVWFYRTQRRPEAAAAEAATAVDAPAAPESAAAGDTAAGSTGAETAAAAMDGAASGEASAEGDPAEVVQAEAVPAEPVRAEPVPAEAVAGGNGETGDARDAAEVRDGRR